MPFAKVEDIKMYYQILGEGKPLLIIWGIGGELPSLVKQLQRELKGYQLIIFDNRGVGRTDKPDIQYTIEMMAADTIGLMDELGIESTEILGISMGSRIALTIAAKNPERVNSLILNVAAARSPQKNNKNAAMAFEKLKIAVKDPQTLNAMGKYPPSEKSFLRLIDALERFDGTKLLKNIMAPTVIINGTNDNSTPVKCAEELKNKINNSKLILVNGDHFFVRTKPELLTKYIIEFLNEQIKLYN